MSRSFTGQLAVIINSYNRMSLLKEALPAIEKTLLNTPVQSYVVVFEAGSTDGSRQFIETYAKGSAVKILCISPPPHLPGTFSDGCNYAIEYAAGAISNLKWCFLYETDNYISNHSALSSALAIIDENESMGAIGFTVEKLDGSKAGYGQKFPSVISFLLGQQLTQILKLQEPRPLWVKEQDHRWTYCDIVYTSPLLVRYDAWKKVNGMDSINFPFSDSDNDWCWRLLKSGWKCAVLDIQGVVHDNRTLTSSWSSKRTLDFHQGRYRLLKKHKGDIIFLIKPLLALRHLSELAILALAMMAGRKKRENLTARLSLIKRVMMNYSHIS